jgi:uncharacterized protein (DUF433 family)
MGPAFYPGRPDMGQTTYKYLGPRPGSSYKQYFINGTRTRAETIYRYIVGPDAMTPEEVADDCGLPLEAVLECVRYCEENEDLLRRERDEDWADMKARGLLHPRPVPAADVPDT